VKKRVVLALVVALMFSACDKKESIDQNKSDKTEQNTTQQNDENRSVQSPQLSQMVFHCTNVPLTDFTLGKNSDPTKEQIDNLCSCVWNHLDALEKETAEKISKSDHNISDEAIKAYPQKFGQAMQDCGAMKL
jgi:hypothetical protein